MRNRGWDTMNAKETYAHAAEITEDAIQKALSVMQLNLFGLDI